MRPNTCPISVAVVFASLTSTVLAQGVGYTDTPTLPGQEWRVHDKDRPNPPVIDPGPAGEPAPLPSDATVLFDGTGTDAWQHADGRDAEWIVKDDGSMQVKAGTGDLQTREHFGDCQLHIEWAAPEVIGKSQGRGNSGVFFFGMYEIQILDSYDNVTYADGQAAALYGQYPPEVNACRAPGEWQSYDIIFEAPRFDSEGNLETPAFVTVLHNGVVVHNRREFLGRTAHRAVASYAPHDTAGPIKLQDHGNPMRFRNIWVRSLSSAEEQPATETGRRD